MDNSPNYEQAIDRTPVLSPAEESWLAIRIRAGRKPNASKMVKANARRAEQRWVEGNLRLVLRVVNKMGGASFGALDRDDLIQEGNLGLMHALEKFDFDRGIRFSTYAVTWIRKYIQQAIDRTARTVRLPAGSEDEIRAINRVRSELEQFLEREPTDEEISYEVGITAQRVRMLRAAAQPPASLYTEDGDVIEVPAPEDPAGIADMVDPASAKGQAVLLLRYGQDLTQGEVARRLGVSISTVQRTEVEALRQLREAA